MSDEQPKHTPGPWDIDPRSDGLIVGCAVHGRTGIHSIAAMAVRDGLTIQQAKANARLIAAAPEMLEILVELKDAGLCWDEWNIPLTMGQRIDDVIRKATT